MKKLTKREKLERDVKCIQCIKIFSLILVITLVIGLVIYSNKEKQTYTTYVPENYTIMYHSYQIKSGDTIDGITRQWLIEHPETAAYIPFDVEKQAIEDINTLNNINEITAGNFIIIPYIEATN